MARGFVVAVALTLAAAGGSRRADQDALKAFAPLVGDWRGAGQVERGRTRGAWTERASWAWSLTQDSAALEVTLTRGKYFRSGKLRPGPGGAFLFEAVTLDGKPRVFAGKPAADGSLPLTVAGDAAPPTPRRVTLRLLHDTRLLMLYEADGDRPGAFERLGEVGFTREGVAFAAGESYPVCVVTEGRGTIPVTYRGKTYHVCCSGCRDLFNENPAAVLAEAEARAKEKAAGKK